MIYHEATHFITFKDCDTYHDYKVKEAEVFREFIFGVSGYSDANGDGVATIAEGFVKRKNGEEVSKAVSKLIDQYIKR